MTIETATRAISLILAPVVLVSGCLLFLNGVMQHYNAISDRYVPYRSALNCYGQQATVSPMLWLPLVASRRYASEK